MPQRQKALFEAKMKRKRFVEWNFRAFSTGFEDFFYLKNTYPPSYLPPDPSSSPPKMHPTLAGKIIRPPTLFNLSTYEYEGCI